ncbi:hypothetical protein NDU88_003451 [Pleurodeles waltl]|uniref:Uncharacterized protein n=1 Tax=Pleurodeles waltl TaxID=8319 RepID=A0AAV7LLN1_PLEWA|nr:hypothetical protein NDU88_003451 [Pleurodeles waltl]
MLGDFLSILKLPKVTDEHLAELKRDLSREELLTVVKNLPRNITLSSDGLPSKFYHTYAEMWADKLIEVFTKAMTLGQLLQSMREATTVMLLKQDRDSGTLRSYRSLSMINRRVKDSDMDVALFALDIKKAVVTVD